MFGWSSGKQQRPQIAHAAHLESYLNDPTLKPSTRNVGSDDSTHDTVFQTKDAHALILRVHFKHASPMMTLVGVTATHPWIDNRMRVTGYAAVQSDRAWLASGLTLGKAVNAVVKHFQLYPPTNVHITDAGLQQIQRRMNAPVQQNRQPMQQSYQPVHGQVVVPETVESDLPPHFSEVLVFLDTDVATHEAILSTMYIPSSPPISFPEVDHMEYSQLNELIHNEQAFKDHMHEMPYVKSMEAIKLKKQMELHDIAKTNLEKEEELKVLCEEVEVLQNGLKKKVTICTDLGEKQTELCKPADKKKTLKKLMIGKKKTYNESEEIAQNWLEDGADVTKFIDAFMETRTVHHVRAAKIEIIQNS